jgi:hypothetical protein
MDTVDIRYASLCLQDSQRLLLSTFDDNLRLRGTLCSLARGGEGWAGADLERVVGTAELLQCWTAAQSAFEGGNIVVRERQLEQGGARREGPAQTGQQVGRHHCTAYTRNPTQTPGNLTHLLQHWMQRTSQESFMCHNGLHAHPMKHEGKIVSN